MGRKSFSIVIVAKNASEKIGRLLSSLQGLSDDVVVCDTGSTDNTVQIANNYNVRLYHMPWEGYGKSKNAANRFAIHDWILSLDADESIDKDLYSALLNWRPTSDTTIYQVRWKNFFGNRWIRNSDWGCNWKNRLFNKNQVRWDDAIAHENLISAHEVKFVRLKGWLDHYSFSDLEEYKTKMENSARLTGLKYHQQNKSCSILNTLLSPIYAFFKVYILKRGFLDGRLGWLIAKTTARYTFLKYMTLKKMNRLINEQGLRYRTQRSRYKAQDYGMVQ